MNRTFRYPLRVNLEQEAVLDGWLWRTRDLHNAALEERITAYRREKQSITFYDQCKSLTQIRANDPAYDEMPVVMSRGPLRRLDRSMKAFFKRCKSGATPGFPRFKGKDRWDSLDFGEAFSIDGDQVRLHKSLTLRFKQYRPLKGEVLACIVKRERGKWFVCFQCRLPDVPKLPVKTATSIDLGLTTFATLYNGDEVPNPRFGKKMEDRIADAQRALSTKKRGSKNREKVKWELSRLYRKLRDRRSDFARQLAAELFKKYDLVAYEDLVVKGLIEKDGAKFAKSITDAAWACFVKALVDKAEKAGRWAIATDPRGTTQNCSRCGERVPKGIRDRTHSCPKCGLVLGRDWNAAINIYDRGLRSVAEDGNGCDLTGLVLSSA